MNPELTLAYISLLTGDQNSSCEWRVINDRVKGDMGKNLSGSYAELKSTLEDYNNAGYGVFMCINAMKASGHTLENVDYIRTHVLDLDDLSVSDTMYQQAVAAHPQPHFAVQTSPNKYHLYWLTEPYTGNEFYTLHQRKIAQLYNGDRSIVDATRVMRVPGFYHMKGEPKLVTCWQISNHPRYSSQQIQEAYQHVNIMEVMHARFALGEPELQAPDLDWVRFALSTVDPNDMEREEWLSFSAAIKQAGWSHADDEQLYTMWSQWCAQYGENDEAENRKLWNSIKDTQVGWPTIKKRTSVAAQIAFGRKEAPQPKQTLAAAPSSPAAPPSPASLPPPPAAQTPPPPTQQPKQFQQERVFDEILDADECEEYFKGCYFIEQDGLIFTEKGRYLNQLQFNGKYSGHLFIITSTGKLTDSPWKAALSSTLYRIPKLDHIRFMPERDVFEFVEDDLGRMGINSYIPPKVKIKEGDVSRFLNHIGVMIPDKNDQKIFLDYMAHCIKYPGHKIQWAPMLQSAEGIGKGIFYDIMKHCLGSPYVYKPKAPELASSGSKFNGWMASKLAIIVDEIKVDERRELIEILKPMITDRMVEVQSKGSDQKMEDNTANWMFFSNYKDAIPLKKNGRRYAIFYSSLQTAKDIFNAGFNDDYFTGFWRWLEKEGGYEALAHWFFNYPIEEGGIPKRAPKTTSYNEAIRISRSPLEIIIEDGIEDGACGFLNGYVSVEAVLNKAKTSMSRTPSVTAIQKMLGEMGYHEIGKTLNPVPQEDITKRSHIYSIYPDASPEAYLQSQGYV